MIDYEKRNAEILRMRKEGVTYKEIGQSFGLSPERVRMIIQRYEDEQKRKERSEKLREAFKAVNNIERKWSKDDILDCLLLHGRAYLSLQRYFDNRKMNEASLKDVMDFLIADYEELPANLFEAMPAYKQKDLGRKTYASLFHHLSEVDLGGAFNSEWTKRLDKLRQYFKRTGQSVPLFLRRYL